MIEWNIIKNNTGWLLEDWLNAWNWILISRDNFADNFASITISGNTITSNSGYWLLYNVWNETEAVIKYNIISRNDKGGLYIWAFGLISQEAEDINLLVQ